MARGGKRAGAGRKKGATTKKTRAIADKAAEDGITPLEVMVRCMRDAWDAGRMGDAQRYAVDAAPYMHPRLASVAHKGDEANPLAVITRIELVAPAHDSRKD